MKIEGLGINVINCVIYGSHYRIKTEGLRRSHKLE